MEERYHSQHSILKRMAGWVTWQKCLRYERWLFPQFNLITMVSQRDCDQVARAIPSCKERLRMIPNGVDVVLNLPDLAVPKPDTLVFNGALSYYANADAMRYFLGEILPRIRVMHPNTILKITGRTDGIDLSQLSLDEHVILTGFLQDIRPVVSESWVCVVPLRLGGGTRLKILEAMALGTPVVSTSKGAEGLDVRDGENILLADDPEKFAQQTVRLLNDPGLRQYLAQNGRSLVEAKYSWAKISADFCRAIEEAFHAAS
jgi:glycosyltransferase involved in cell wall biosynthesis